MPTHPNNRPHSPDQATGDFLYQIYKVLFEAEGIALVTKQRTFETATVSKDSWRVVSISQKALEHLSDPANLKPASGLRRGHIMSRVERAKQLFERDKAMSRDELLKFFFEHDTVALVTTGENTAHGAKHWSQLYQVPEGHFTAGSFSIKIRKIEREWVIRAQNGGSL